MVNFANFAASSLDGGIDDTETSIDLLDASDFPSGDFYLTVEAEYMYVSSRTGNTLTVTRGVDNSTAVSHSSGARAVLLLTVAGLNDRHSENYQYGTYANRPTGARSGQMYFCTDYPVVFIYDGSNWIAYGPIHVLNKPPTSGWSWEAQGTSSVTHTDLGLLLTKTQDGNSSRIYRALTYTNDYSVEVGIIATTPTTSNNNYAAGLFKASGNYHEIHLTNRVFAYTRNSSYSVSATPFNPNTHQRDYFSRIWFFKFRVTGGNIITYISNNRAYWVQLASVATDTAYGSTIVPDNFYMKLFFNDGNFFTAAMHLVHYLEVDES